MNITPREARGEGAISLTMLHGRDFTLSWTALAATVAAMAAACAYYAGIVLWGGSAHPRSEVVGFLVTLPLLYSNLVYQVSRLGALRREQAHRPQDQEELERIYGRSAPSLTVLIPSYMEQPQVLRQTVLSAALLEYPGRRIVVLIDDPPSDRASRAARLQAGPSVEHMLSQEAMRLQSELAAFRRRRACVPLDVEFEQRNLARLYLELAAWF